MFVPPAGYLLAAQELLRKHKALLICDEVQTGLGRTGTFFAYEDEGLEPDLVTVAKTLSGGFVPVGATLGKEWIFQKVYSSMDRVLVHDSTFGSNGDGDDGRAGHVVGPGGGGPHGERRRCGGSSSPPG